MRTVLKNSSATAAQPGLALLAWSEPLIAHPRWVFVVVWTTLFLLRGLVYLVVIPPWQAPDEPTSVELLLTMEAQGRLVSRQDQDLGLQRKIIESMDRSRYWEMGGFAYGHPQGENATFEKVYYPGATQLGRPALYHLLLLPFAKMTDEWPVEQQLLVLRAATLLIGSATVAIIALLSYELVIIHPAMPLVLPALAAWHPQFTYSNTTFNADNLVALLGAGMFWLVWRLFRYPRAFMSGVMLCVLMLLGIWTKRTILFIAPALLVAIGLKTTQIARRDKRFRFWLFVALAIAGLTIITVILVPSLRRLAQRFIERFIIYGDLYFIGYYLLHIPASIWRWAFETALPFLNRSFWGSFGWHQVALPTVVNYILMGLVAVSWFVSIGGMIVRRNQYPHWVKNFFWICAFAAVSIVAIVVNYERAPGVPQGRYLFPALIPILVLIAAGLCAWWPRKAIPIGVALVWLGLIALDLYTILAVIIPGFYF